MNRTTYYIRILMMMLLLVGGGIHEAWAQTKTITYHVITLPFSNESTNNIEYRIEAIKKTVTQDESEEIKLPSDLKSPLMKYEAYSYYTDVTKSDLINIFPDNDSKFYTYTFGSATNVTGKKVSNLSGTDVYVTYTWDDDHDNLKEDYGKKLDLTGDKTYNIEFSTSAGKWFYALNMDNDRGNRGQSIPAEYLNDIADLCSDEPVRIKQAARNKYNFYFKWKLTNNDPYNIILKTATNTGIDYTEDGFKKNNGGAQFYGSLESASKIRSNWVTNEVNKAYNSKTTISSETRHGWFRGTKTPIGRNSRDNGVINHLYFSFSLLNRSTASEGDYTLAASWVAVDGDDWVPNSSGQYLLMQHDPVHDLPYAGVKFMTFSATDQVKFHEIREYTYKVKTPLSNTILATSLEWSDYGKDSVIIKHVPEALKRKYTTIEGTYADAAFNTKRTTFFDLYNNDEPDVKKPRDIWLKYEVSASIPFEAGTGTSTFSDQKWYNIYVNKEEKYTTWYDKTDGNKFNTLDGSSGHTKYAHESHFSFIGDPYELRVANRLSSEDASDNLRYMKLGASSTSSLVSGTSNTSDDYTYRALPSGISLIIGNKYYTTDPSSDQFTSVVAVDGGYYEKEYVGRVSNGSNYYEKIDHYVAVANGTLTAGNVYYTSDQGDGIFISDGTETADETHHYYTYNNSYYVAVPDGTRLTIGKTYYTSSGGEGGFVAEYLKSDGTDYHERLYSSNWEIINDNNTGDYAGCFRLRQFRTYDAAVTIGWDASSKRPLNGNGSGGSTEARLSVLELPIMNYTYYIVDKSGNIAVKATEEQITGTTLNYDAIPEVIRSPFIYGADLTFYTYDSSDKTTHTTVISHTNSEENNEYKNHIFVTYSNLNSTYESLINGSQEYNVALYNQYIYHDEDNDNHTIKSVNGLEGNTASNHNYLWILGGEDPYAMTIKNKNYQYVEVPDLKGLIVEEHDQPDGNPDWAEGTLSWSSGVPASKFIIKAGSLPNTYEVMAATGTEVDASVTYYNIGRTDATTVQMYSNTAYSHGYEQIRFQLKKSSAKSIIYHLIDLSKNDLLQETGRQAKEEQPIIPSEIVSPLVKKYTYWKSDPRIDDSDSKKYGENEKFEDYYKTPDFAADYWDNNDIHVYITYVANDLVDMHHTTMYLLKYEQGELFRQEDGSDGLLPEVTAAEIAGMTEEEEEAYIKTYKAVYPYCNGDGNFFVYGQQQYETQQEGAASTRTRWAWYLESGNEDPYHVKILSRQTETYDGLERSAYFSTRQFDGWDEVVTALVWPNISGVQATEYMVLGSVGQYQLVTTYPVTLAIDKNGDGDTKDEGETTTARYVVDSFEQYWKTYDTVKKKLLSDLLPTCEERERTDRTDGSIEVPDIPPSLRQRLTKKISEGGDYEFHSYQKMANAKRWNGYNASGEKKKGWETREHWFQTVKMGSGYFDLIPTVISPALILLDQHGWEIMRKPLPYSDQDPDKEAKKDVLRTYDSPMVKEYIYWASAKKRSGFHQYYLMDKRIGGSDYSSTSLGDLPPWGSENVVDNKGNQYDEYVTYIVKEEYAISYAPSSKTGAEFLIRQGDDLAKKGAVPDNKISVVPDPGSVSQYIINNISTLSDELWYVKPNADIDTEMGYTASNHNWSTDNPNAYEDPAFRDNQVASIIEGASDNATVKKYGRFSFSNGFDPYNIQISSKNDAKYFTTGMTGANVEEGIMVGKYGSTTVTLADKTTEPVDGKGYDNAVWKITNQTYMAVQDKDGNMQLMPRFDHTFRVQDFVALVTPTEEAGQEDKLEKTYTQLYRPFVYNYRIIDNEGHESLRYQSGGDLMPQTADHLKSPLAKDFKYYKNLTYDGTDTYTEIPAHTDISSKEITTSLAGAGLTASGLTSNPVYVRYAYDEDADVQHILHGKWLTMTLNEQDVVYSAGNGIRKGTGTKPNPVDGNTNQAWQWKFLQNPYTTPDPYAVKLFNRSQREGGKDRPMSVIAPDLNNKLVTAQDDGTSNYFQRFALLSHTDANSYAMAVAGTKDLNYYFLQGIGTDGTSTISTGVSASVRKEEGVTGATCSFDFKKSQIILTDDVINTYIYKVYTNGGDLAIDDTQTHYEAADNEFMPKLPEAIQTPLLNDDQFRYYEALTDTAYNSGKALTYLYGLYGQDVYVRYNAYDQNVSEYKVPNEKTTINGVVAKGSKSNDAPLRLDNFLPHNIIWYNDNMMTVDKDGEEHDIIANGGSQPLQNETAYVWTFEGNDPYAIKIRHKTTTEPYMYVHQAPASTTELSEDATTFMLLNRDGYEYGVFAVTGEKEKMLTGYGNQLTTSDTDPTKFIIFSLGTLKVIYHLVIANIGEHEDIPYRERENDENYKTNDGSWNVIDGYYTDVWASTDVMEVNGTTERDLTTKEHGVDGDKYQLGETISTYPSLDGQTTGNKTYCKDVGPVSLGDALAVPDEFYRPNVNYFFVVHDIRNDDDSRNNNLNKQYRGLQITSKEMSMNEDLIGKKIYINILYRFNTDLKSNSGDNFVMSVGQNKWYTLETVINGTPWLAQYTNAWGFELKEGRGSHYTNDFLWTPVGDPYGFQLFNRYMDINSGDDNLGEKDRVIFSRHFANNVKYSADDPNLYADIHDGGQQILMGNYKDSQKLVVVGRTGGPIVSYPKDTVATNSIYELLESTTPGYFRFHPVANNSGTQYYFNPAKADDDGDEVDNILVRLSTTAAEFTFNLSAELMKPYFDRAGYVGGLKKSVYDAPENATLVAAMKADNPVLSLEQLQAAQELVYDYKNNIVPVTTGYYRLHSPLGISGIDPVRYVSGYTHKIELTGDGDLTHSAIPMHFYEKNSDEVRQFTDFKEGGFTPSYATRGDITIPPVVKDPASIFYFEKIYRKIDYPNTVKTAEDTARYNLGYISTQGLYVRGTVAKGVAEAVGERAKAVMTDHELSDNMQTPGADNPTPLFVMDLGGGVLLIHDNQTANGRSVLKYLSYDYSNDTPGNSTIYDMKLTNHTHTDHAKFCMQPVQDTETLGINEMPLKWDMKQDKGTGYFYASFCAPFDVLLADAKSDTAYICKVWDTEIIHLKKIGKYNTGDYEGNNQFVPAGTPVIIRSNKSSVTLALPTKKPSTAIGVNIFQGEYLEQLLPKIGDGALDVYTFGYPMTAKSVTPEKTTGVITFDQQQKGESGMGFYINATPNRESAADMGSWIRNNWYVYGNKVYYRDAASPAPQRRSPEFIPVVFDDDDADEDENSDNDESSTLPRRDNRVYDLQGRCVATEQEVKDGTWKDRLPAGVYILNGKKVMTSKK